MNANKQNRQRFLLPGPLVVGTIIYSVPFIPFLNKWDKWDAINDGPYKAAFLLGGIVVLPDPVLDELDEWDAINDDPDKAGFLHCVDIGLPISVVTFHYRALHAAYAYII